MDKITKKCNKCGIVKKLSDFYISKQGYRWICKNVIEITHKIIIQNTEKEN